MIRSVAASVTIAVLVAGCGWKPSELNRADRIAFEWRDIVNRAVISLDVGCANQSAARLQQAYTTVGHVATVRTLASGRRYLLLTERNSGHQDVFFPGADPRNAGDILADAMADKQFDPTLGVWLHRGFHWAATEAADDLMLILDAHSPLSVTGYSLGGAIAAIVGAKLKRHGYSIDSVVTFGQPPVTDADGAQALSGERILRFVAGDDWAPLLFSNRYVHFGDEVCLLQGAAYTYARHEDGAYVRSGDGSAERIDVFCHYNYVDLLLPKISRATEVSNATAEVLAVVRPCTATWPGCG